MRRNPDRCREWDYPRDVGAIAITPLTDGMVLFFYGTRVATGPAAARHSHTLTSTGLVLLG
jgi:hypothetical protein